MNESYLNNINIKPITDGEVLQLVKSLKEIIKRGNEILKLFDKVARRGIEKPANTCSSAVSTQSPLSNSVFSASPIKLTRKTSVTSLANDSGKKNFNNTKVLSFVRFSLLSILIKITTGIKQLDNLTIFDTSEIVDACLQCVIYALSISTIIEDTIESHENDINDKGKLSIKGKKYIMGVIYKIRLYLVSMLNDIKTVSADEILLKYRNESQSSLIDKEIKSRKQKISKKLSDINEIIENELKNYSTKKNDVVLRGFLQKKRENEKFMSGFKKKYFMLTHKALMYCDKEITENYTMGTSKFLMFCDYDGIERIPEDVVKRKYCMRLFSTKDPNQSMYLAASDEIEEILWFNQLRDKMYINNNYFTSEDENVVENESDEYRNITDDELNTILRLINKEEKVKINLLKYVYINKMNEIIQKITPNVELEINKNDNDIKKQLLRLERLRNEDIDLFLSLTTNCKQEDFLINLLFNNIQL